MRGAGLPPAERYLAFSTYYTTTELGALLTPGFAAGLGGYDPLAGHRELFDRVGDVDELSRLLYLDAKTFLPCLNLTYTDKMAMAASVEVRVPLLDDELVALAARIPSQPQAEPAEAQVHLQEEPGVGAAARHRLAAEGGLRRADPLVAGEGSRTARARRALRGDTRPSWHRRPCDRGPADG